MQPNAAEHLARLGAYTQGIVFHDQAKGAIADFLADLEVSNSRSNKPRNGLKPPTSAPGLGSPLSHLHEDCAHACHICTGLAKRKGPTRLTPMQACVLTTPRSALETDGEAAGQLSADTHLATVRAHALPRLASHLHRAGTGPTPCHICAGTGPTPCHICAGTGPTPRPICAGTGGVRSFGVLRFSPPVRAPLSACVHTYGVHMRVLRLCAFATLTPAACCLDRTPTAVTRLRALAPSALRRRGCAFSERSPVHTAWHQRTQTALVPTVDAAAHPCLVRHNVHLACSARYFSAWHGLPRSPT
jgi:hypothetical protein